MPTSALAAGRQNWPKSPTTRRQRLGQQHCIYLSVAGITEGGNLTAHRPPPAAAQPSTPPAIAAAAAAAHHTPPARGRGDQPGRPGPPPGGRGGAGDGRTCSSRSGLRRAGDRLAAEPPRALTRVERTAGSVFQLFPDRRQGLGGAVSRRSGGGGGIGAELGGGGRGGGGKRERCRPSRPSPSTR